MEPTARPVWRTRAWGIACILFTIVLLGLSVAGYEGPEALWPMLTTTAVIIVAILAMTLLRVRRERRAYEERLTAWAAERAAQEERLHIARELHDLASHGLGLITVRAAAASRFGEQHSPTENTQALIDIEQISRQATTELRRMLTVLRSSGSERSEIDTASLSAPASGTGILRPSLRPTGSFDDLADLVESASQAGLVVATDLSGDLTRLGAVSPGVQLTVYTIVREALANVARHAGPTTVHVSLRRMMSDVVVTVHDEGPVDGWEATPGTRLGLTGLRERVTVLGGSIEAESTSDGFRLHAVLPDEAR